MCYSLASLRGLFDAHAAFDVETVHKVEYAWDTELGDCKVPRAVAKPFDWCAVVRRREVSPEEEVNVDG